MRGLIEGPVYTRPRAWREREVPQVLLSGNHAEIARWRRDMALRRTAAHRPDLIGALPDLDPRDRQAPPGRRFLLHEGGPSPPGSPLNRTATPPPTPPTFPPPRPERPA